MFTTNIKTTQKRAPWMRLQLDPLRQAERCSAAVVDWLELFFAVGLVQFRARHFPQWPDNGRRNNEQ